MGTASGTPRRGLLAIAASAVLVGAVAAYLYFPGLRGGPVSRPSPSPSSDRVTATAFTSSDSAWVALADLSGRAAVYATSDHGGSWKRKLTLPKGTQVQAIQFTGPRQGLLLAVTGPSTDRSARTFYTTTDAGDHWNEVAPQGLPAGVGQVAFVDPDHGWATGSDTPNITSLYHTVDGARSWVRVVQLAAVTQISGVVTGAVAFVDDQVGWLGTTTRGAAPMLYPDPFTYGTRDGGRSWQMQALSAPPGGWPSGAAVWALPPTCMPAGPCLLAATLMFSSGPAPRPGNVIQVYKSEDGAGPWHDPVTAPAGSPTAAVGVFFLNADNWWALGAGGLSSTADAGRSWSVLSPQLPESIAGLYGIVIKSPRVAWAFGYRQSGQPAASRDSPPQRVLLRTSTAGIRWSEVPLPSLDR